MEEGKPPSPASAAVPSSTQPASVPPPPPPKTAAYGWKEPEEKAPSSSITNHFSMLFGSKPAKVQTRPRKLFFAIFYVLVPFFIYSLLAALFHPNPQKKKKGTKRST